MTRHTAPTAIRAAGAALLLAASASAQQHPQDIFVTPLSDDPFTTDVQSSRDVLLCDVDGNGSLDILVANTDQPNSIYSNDGSASFTRINGVAFTTGTGNSRGLAAGDVDGDGDHDVYVCQSKNQPNVFYMNAGGLQNGTTGDLVPVGGSLVASVTNSRKARFADLDGDGDLDLFIANFDSTPDDVFVNQGGAQGGTQGDFQPLGTSPITSGAHTSYASSMGDVDNDGDLDVYVTHHDGLAPPTPGARNALFLNDGSMGFTEVNKGAPVTDLGNSLTTQMGDIDGDGDIDIFVGNDEHNDNALYMNDGAANFTRKTDDIIVVDRGESIGSALVDIDGDDDLDLVTANRKGQYNVLYMQQHDGSFKRQSFGPFKVDRFESYDVELGDLDGDDDLDFVFANNGQGNTVYSFERSQWTDLGNAHAGGPSADIPSTPTLDGEGNLKALTPVRLFVSDAGSDAPASLMIGLTAANVPFKGGVLVPSPDLLVAGLNTNEQGKLVMAGKMPTGIPAGLSLHFQVWIALEGGGFSATNALRAYTP